VNQEIYKKVLCDVSRHNRSDQPKKHSLLVERYGR
jgi:hypothetical protein